jgi:hypothetical protein
LTGVAKVTVDRLTKRISQTKVACCRLAKVWVSHGKSWFLASNHMLDTRDDSVKSGQKMFCVATNIGIRRCTERRKDRLEAVVLISDPCRMGFGKGSRLR